MSVFTKTPVNAVLFCANRFDWAWCAGVRQPDRSQRRPFMAVTGQSIAYLIHIASRWIWREENGWIPGAFSRGAWVSALVASIFECEAKHRRFKIGRAASAQLLPSSE